MAALKLSLIQKYKLENAYTYVYSTGFLSPTCPEQGARALVLTRKEEASGVYTVLVLSETGIQEIELGEDFLDRENDPVLFFIWKRLRGNQSEERNFLFYRRFFFAGNHPD